MVDNLHSEVDEFQKKLSEQQASLSTLPVCSILRIVVKMVLPLLQLLLKQRKCHVMFESDGQMKKSGC